MNEQPTVESIEIIQQQLKRQARWIRLSFLAWGLLLSLFLLGGASEPLMVSTLDKLDVEEINVSRINVVEDDGVVRLVIANAEKYPEAIVNGKSYAREYQPAGILFYDAKGSEMGGLAMTDAAGNRVSALAFDYPNFDAVGMRCVVTEKGDSTTGIVINSKPPTELEPIEAARVVKTRIGIQNRNENAEILLSDKQGNERIRLVVNEDGEPRIELLDADGRVIQKLPESR